MRCNRDFTGAAGHAAGLATGTIILLSVTLGGIDLVSDRAQDYMGPDGTTRSLRTFGGACFTEEGYWKILDGRTNEVLSGMNVHMATDYVDRKCVTKINDDGKIDPAGKPVKVRFYVRGERAARDLQIEGLLRGGEVNPSPPLFPDVVPR